MSCQRDRYYLDVLTLFKIPKTAMAQVPQTSTKHVTRQKNRIVSNHCCTYSCPSTFRFPPPLAKYSYCLLPLCLSTLQSCNIIALLCTKINAQEEGDGAHYHSGQFKASKPPQKSPRAISPYSSPPSSMLPSLTFYTFTFSHFCNSALHSFVIHIQVCVLNLVLNSSIKQGFCLIIVNSWGKVTVPLQFLEEYKIMKILHEADFTIVSKNL